MGTFIAPLTLLCVLKNRRRLKKADKIQPARLGL